MLLPCSIRAPSVLLPCSIRAPSVPHPCSIRARSVLTACSHRAFSIMAALVSVLRIIFNLFNTNNLVELFLKTLAVIYFRISQLITRSTTQDCQHVEIPAFALISREKTTISWSFTQLRQLLSNQISVTIVKNYRLKTTIDVPMIDYQKSLAQKLS